MQNEAKKKSPIGMNVCQFASVHRELERTRRTEEQAIVWTLPKAEFAWRNFAGVFRIGICVKTECTEYIL